jgi:hypothetical protein
VPYDLYLTIGVVILVFAIPSIVSAFSDGHAPRAAAIMVLIGGGLVAGAATQKPGGYVLTEVPEVFVRVVSQYTR